MHRFHELWSDQCEVSCCKSTKTFKRISIVEVVNLLCLLQYVMTFAKWRSRLREKYDDAESPPAHTSDLHIAVVFACPRFGWGLAWEVNPLFALWQHLADQLDLNLSALEYMMKCYPEIKEKEEMRKVVGRYGLTGQQQVRRVSSLCGYPIWSAFEQLVVLFHPRVWTAVLSHPCGNRYIVWCLLRQDRTERPELYEDVTLKGLWREFFFSKYQGITASCKNKQRTWCNVVDTVELSNCFPKIRA